MNGDCLEGMEVDTPLLHSTALPSPPQPQQSPLLTLPLDRPHILPEHFELNTDQIKRILAFGKDLQRLYDSITRNGSNDKLKVLLQVTVLQCMWLRLMTTS